jgi:serine/threonine protein kinase
MEYADSGTLQDYLKKNFSKLTWSDKYSLAYQLVCSVSCLHDEEIIHRDLVISFKIIFYNKSILPI